MTRHQQISIHGLVILLHFIRSRILLNQENPLIQVGELVYNQRKAEGKLDHKTS